MEADAMWSKRFAVVVLMAGLGAVVAAGAESVGVLLRKGIYQEETVGDLDAAIKIYQGIVADEKANRPHVAQAKFRLGMCHVKKGEKEKAVGMFEGLVKEFPGQAKLVELARGRLAALGHVPESEEPAGIELQETWPFAGLDEHNVLAISRDGRYFAFDPGIGGLTVRDLMNREDQLSIETGADFRIIGALISPDNKWVAYTGRKSRDGTDLLRVAAIDGSEARVLDPNEESTNIELMDWSPDSQHVLVSFRLADLSVGIATISVADGSTKVLKALLPYDSPNCRFSPDGRYVAYCRMAKPVEEDIFLIPLDGGPEIHLIENPADEHVFGWLPDGKGFLFRSDRRGEGPDIWMIQVVDGKPQGVPRLVTKGVSTRGHFGPVRTPTGGWAFYYREPGESKVVSSAFLAALDPDTGELLNDLKPVSQPTAGRERAMSPDFSRDGKYLAYYVAPAPEQSPNGPRYGPGNIVIRSLETDQEREITLSPKLSHAGALNVFSRWAPDGRSIICCGQAETGRFGLYRVDIDTGNLNPLVLDAPELTKTDWQLPWALGDTKADRLAWVIDLSPDGKTLFFARLHWDPNAAAGEQVTQCRVVARDLETDQEKVIYRNPDGAFDGLTPGVSPDGERLSIGSETMLKVFTSAGGEPRELLGVEEESSPRFGWTNRMRWTLTWTADSRHLLFMKFDQGRAELWRISAEGGEPERIGKLPAALGTSIWSLRVHPKGRQVAFHANRRVRQRRIRMMQIVASSKLAKEICTENLRTIGKAIEQYKNDHDDVPDGFADLYPDYLQDTHLLLCPADDSGGEPLEGANDGKTRCSYEYLFDPSMEGLWRTYVALPADWPAEEELTWKEARKRQVEYYGGIVPIAKCPRHHGHLYLGYDGEVYETRHGYWERCPQAKAGLLDQLKAAMKAEPDTWAQRYDMQRFYCLLTRAGEDEAVLAKLLETHIKEHPGHKNAAAQESLTELPKLRLTGSLNEAEEHSGGQISLNNGHLELVPLAVGLRFQFIPVPQGARIKRAYVQFTAYGGGDPGSEHADLVLHAELTTNAGRFSRAKHNITSRPKTAASVKWSPEPWTVGGERSEKQRTPDLSSLIQEVVNQPDWRKNSRLVLVISGSGRRNAESWEGGWSGVPMLYVEH